MEYQMQASTRHPSSTGADTERNSDEGEEPSPRDRLIQGMASALATKGYAATTIADIVRLARVSKRTFYEHFADKEACFLACYGAMSEIALHTLEQEATSEAPWRERIRRATKAYLSVLESQPGLTRALLMEIQAAGPGGLKMRREVMQRFADTLQTLVERGRKHEPSVRPLSSSMATAIVGGVHELTLLAVEEGRADRLTELADTATELVEAVLTAAR